MISVEGLKVEFGVKPLFHDVSFVINDRDRINTRQMRGSWTKSQRKLCSRLLTKSM